MTRVLIAEDHTLVSQGLQAMLALSDDLELVGIASTGEDAIEQVRREDVDIVLMDVNLGSQTNGIEATRRIKEIAPETKILVLTMFTDPGTVTQAINAGADGYLSKGASRQAVVGAIDDIMNGRAVLDPHVTHGVFGKISNRDPHSLTEREMTVLQELSHGLATREIAEQIYVSEETVKAHLKQIYRKLNVKDRTEAVAEAFRRGLVH